MTTTPTTASGAPIACSLPPGQYRARTAELAALAARALRSRAPIDGGERLVFGGDDGVERELRAAIAAEARCCSFLTMRLERSGGQLTVDVTGPAEAQPVIAKLFVA